MHHVYRLMSSVNDFYAHSASRGDMEGPAADALPLRSPHVEGGCGDG